MGRRPRLSADGSPVLDMRAASCSAPPAPRMVWARAALLCLAVAVAFLSSMLSMTVPLSVTPKDLYGRVYVVTGCTEGSIGFVVAEKLAVWNAHVVCGMRDAGKAARAEALIASSVARANSKGRIETGRLDLLDFASVRAFAAELLRRHAAIDGLVLNAGIAVSTGASKDGHNSVLQTNHYAQFLLLRLLEERLDCSSLGPEQPSQVVFVTSMAALLGQIKPDEQGSHKVGPGGVVSPLRVMEWFTYADTKLMNRITARELARRHPDGRTVFVSVCPGIVLTRIWDRKTELTQLARLLDPLLQLFARSAETGSSRILQVIAGNVPVKSGDYVDSYLRLPYAPAPVNDANGAWLYNETSKIVGLEP